MATETVGLAIIGSGRIGAVHLANMIGNTRIDVKWVVDIDEKVAKKNAALTEHAKATTNVDDVLNDPSVHGIVICTPTAAHKEIILKAAQKGKAIMCEKPISLVTKEIDECYEECKKLKVPLLCGYQRRSDPSFVKLKEACKKGTIGTVQTIKTISRDNPVPTLAYLKISGKIFHDCGSHDIDICRWIAEEDPCQVYAVASAFNPDIKALEDWDTVLITLKFPSGRLANIDLSRKACYGYDQRIEVLGDKGMVQAQNRQPTTTVISTVEGIQTDPFCYSFPQRYTEAYAHEMDHFVDVILKKAEPKLSHEDARKVAIIAEAAEESCKLGKPIDLKY